MSLDPFEHFALHSLAGRRPLFRWEAEAVCEEVMERLRTKGLIALFRDDWILTDLGAASLQLGAVKVLGSVPRSPSGVFLDEVSVRRFAKQRV